MKKNLLFITADQWRGECLSVLGHQVQTPSLDSLAASGVLFSNHFANAVPCGPSRASLHTGMYLQNHRSGTNGTPLDARHSNWALEIRKAGYTPVLFGYTDTANDPRMFNSDDPILKSYEGPLPGIEPIVPMGTFPHAWADWLAEKGYDIPESVFGLYTNKKSGDNKVNPSEFEYEAGGPVPLPLAIPAEDHDTWFMTDQVMEYIEQQDSDWCVHLSLLRPHPPWVAPEPYNALYPPESLEGYKRAEDVATEKLLHPFLSHFLNKRGFKAPLDDNRQKRLKASYYGLMSEVDANLGRLFDFLKATDQWSNTIIIFTSDHGEQMGDHWLLGKLGYFDESYHIPLIVYDPDARADESRGIVVESFTENVDIMPTLLNFLDLEIPVQCDGLSLLPFLHSNQVPGNWRQEAHWEFDFRDIINGEEIEKELNLTQHQCTLNVIRSNDYKYVHFTDLPPLFFDLKKDPHELVNQASNPEYLPLVLEYTQKMLSWRMNHDEQLLTHLTLSGDGVIARKSSRYKPHS